MLVDDHIQAIRLANENGIELSFENKYEKGKKAKGPRNWRKVNLQIVENAVANNYQSATLWSG